jgi:hypothetical protein
LATWEEKGWAIGLQIFLGGATNLYKNFNEAQQFLEDLVLYIFKGYRSFSTCENIWLHMLVLQQCPCVVFPFHSSLLERMLLTMVTKTIKFHVLPHLSFATTMSTKFFSLDVQR